MTSDAPYIELLPRLCLALLHTLPNQSDRRNKPVFSLDGALAESAIKRHRVGALLANAVDDQTDVPPDVLARLKAKNQKTVMTYLLQASVLHRLDVVFEHAPFEVIPIKGRNLADQIYPTPSTREAKDIDILVSKEAYPMATQHLLNAGFELSFRGRWLTEYDPKMALSKETEFRDSQTGCCIELHNRLFHYDPAGFTKAFLEQTSRPLTIHESYYALYVIMHGANAFWSRLKWVIDLAFLLDALAENQRDEIIALGKSYGFDAAFWASLCLLERCFPDVVDADWQQRLTRPKARQSVLALTDRFYAVLSSPPRKGLPPKVPNFHEPRGLIFERSISWPTYVYARSRDALLKRWPGSRAR